MKSRFVENFTFPFSPLSWENPTNASVSRKKPKAAGLGLPAFTSFYRWRETWASLPRCDTPAVGYESSQNSWQDDWMSDVNISCWGIRAGGIMCDPPPTLLVPSGRRLCSWSSSLNSAAFLRLPESWTDVEQIALSYYFYSIFYSLRLYF